MNLLKTYLEMKNMMRDPDAIWGPSPLLSWMPDEGLETMLFKGQGKALRCHGRVNSHSYQRRQTELCAIGERRRVETPGLPAMHVVDAWIQFEHYEDYTGYFTDIANQKYYSIETEEYEYRVCVTQKITDNSAPEEEMYCASLYFQCVDIRRKI